MSKLDEVLNVKPDEILKVSVPNELIKRLADVPPLGVLLEFIENSLDEIVKLEDEGKGSKQSRHIEIELNRQGPKPYIRLSDYTTGMDEETIRRIPTKIGSSKKSFERIKGLRDVMRTHGYRGQGVFSYQAIANQIAFVSKPQGKHQANWLKHDAPAKIISAQTLEEFDEKQHGTAAFSRGASREKSGTDVYLIGTGREDWRKAQGLLQDRLVEKLGRVLGSVIKKYDLTIDVIEGKLCKTVKPMPYRGEPLFPRPLSHLSKLGDSFTAELYLLPEESTSKVELRHKDVIYVEDVTRFDSLSIMPFTSGSLEGVIGANNLSLPGGKVQFDQRDQNTKEFIDWVLKEVVPYATQRVKEAKEKLTEQARIGAYKIVQAALKSALQEIDLPVTGCTVTVPGTPRGPYGTREKPEIKDKDKDHEPRVRKLNVSVPNIDEKTMDKDVMSEYDKSMNIVRVNRRHDLYQRAHKSPEGHLDYLLALLAKHVVCDVMERTSPYEATDLYIQITSAARHKLPRKA